MAKRFSSPYDGYKTYIPTPEKYGRSTGWLSTFNIALVAIGIGLSFIPGFGEIIPQFIIGESIAAVQTGVMAGAGIQPNAWQTGLSFGLPFISGGSSLIRNYRSLNTYNTAINTITKNNLIEFSQKGYSYDIKLDGETLFNRQTIPYETSHLIGDIKSNIKYNYEIYKGNIKTYINKNYFDKFNLSNNDFNYFENVMRGEINDELGRLSDIGIKIQLGGDINRLKNVIKNLLTSAKTIARTVDITDTMRAFGLQQSLINDIMELFFYAQEGLTEEYRNIYVIRMIEMLDIENEFAQGLKNTIAAIYDKLLKTNAEINVERIFVRAWRDMLYSSPKRFMTRYGFESPLLKLRYETKATSWQEIQKLLSSQKTRRLRQGARMLNPTMVSRSAVNYFARKMTRYVNNLIKNLKKFKQNTDISTDKSGISGMDQENAILRTSKNLAADAFKRLKTGEVIALPSAWLLSIRIIENLVDESLCIITFQQVPTKNKEPVLVWANDKQLLELLDRPGNTYLDYFATSRGGKLVSLGSVLGMRGSIIPPSILHLIGVGLPTQALRNLISIASNVKKAVDGNYLKKWENPQQYLFKNFYLYGVSRGSRLIGRTLMGGMINHILGGRLSSAITGKIGKQLDHTLTHLIPMEGQRLMTTFTSTPIRNLLSGRNAFSGMKRAMEINTARVIRDHTRFFAAQSNRRLGVLQNISIGRKVNLYGRGASIFTGNKWKRTKW